MGAPEGKYAFKFEESDIQIKTASGIFIEKAKRKKI